MGVENYDISLADIIKIASLFSWFCRKEFLGLLFDWVMPVEAACQEVCSSSKLGYPSNVLLQINLLCIQPKMHRCGLQSPNRAAQDRLWKGRFETDTTIIINCFLSMSNLCIKYNILDINRN